MQYSYSGMERKKTGGQMLMKNLDRENLWHSKGSHDAVILLPHELFAVEFQGNVLTSL